MKRQRIGENEAKLLRKATKALDQISKVIDDLEHDDGGNNGKNGRPCSSQNCVLCLKKIKNILDTFNEFKWMNSENYQGFLSSSQKVLSNGLLLQKILGEIPSSRQILNLRRVSKLWAAEGSRALRQPPHHRRIQVSFRWISGDDFDGYMNTKASLDQFHKFVFDASLSMGWTFPCGHFSFSGGDLGNSDVRSFFLAHKNLIRGLTLDLLDHDPVHYNPNFRGTSAETLRTVLFDTLTKLTFLTLVAVPWNRTLSEDVPDRLAEEETILTRNFGDPGKILPNLKFIDLPQHTNGQPRSPTLFSPVMTEILAAAVNLSGLCSSQNFDLIMGWMREILAGRKIHLVKSLGCSSDPGHCEQLKVIAKGNPKLNVFSITTKTSMYSTALPEAPAIHEILESSKSSLREIRGVNVLSTLYGSRGSFPVFDKVHTISVTSYCSRLREKWALLPQGVDLDRDPDLGLQTFFPNLTTLDLSFYLDIEETWGANSNSAIGMEHPFSHLSNAHSTLETLKLSDTFLNFWPPYALENAGFLYPNLKVLELQIYMKGQNFPTTCQVIWRSLVNLEKLTFNLIWGYNEQVALIEENDSAFTGINVGVCRQLRFFIEMNWNFQLLEQHREKVSISNLRHLKELHVTSAKEPIFSRISWHYAFQPMKLQVTVQNLPFNSCFRGHLNLNG